MGPQRFRAVIAAGSGNRAVIVVPFDPDEMWGAKAAHPVGGTIDGKAYLRWIDATTRRPDVPAARIAEVVDLLAAGIEQRPRS
jgi:hypothetical protein